VAEHIRRPRDFTCYSLEEPIVVGSGMDGSSAVDNVAAQAAAVAKGCLGLGEVETARLEGTRVGFLGDEFNAVGMDVDAEELPEMVEFVQRDGAVTSEVGAGDERQRRRGAGGVATGVQRPMSFVDGTLEEDGNDGDAAMATGEHARPQQQGLLQTGARQRRRFRTHKP
jgi:hypothetical protein